MMNSTQYTPIQPRLPPQTGLVVDERMESQESEGNLDLGLTQEFMNENDLGELFGFQGHTMGDQYVQETVTEVAAHPLVETPPPEQLQPTLDFVSLQPSFRHFNFSFQSSVAKTEQGIEVELTFPKHPLKANGISYFNDKGVLYATHRLKDQKQVPFGISGISERTHPSLIAFMYASIPGNLGLKCGVFEMWRRDGGAQVNTSERSRSGALHFQSV